MAKLIYVTGPVFYCKCRLLTKWPKKHSVAEFRNNTGECQPSVNKLCLAYWQRWASKRRIKLRWKSTPQKGISRLVSAKLVFMSPISIQSLNIYSLIICPPCDLLCVYDPRWSRVKHTERRSLFDSQDHFCYSIQLRSNYVIRVGGQESTEWSWSLYGCCCCCWETDRYSDLQRGRHLMRLFVVIWCACVLI